MTQQAFGIVVIVAVVGMVAAACGNSQQPAGAGDLNVEFKSQPDPPTLGENAFEVMVTEADGTPVTDAAVTVAFLMAAMPSMNMPEMRNSTPLSHEGGGMYRGRGQVMMAGVWDVTVNVTRGDQTLASRKLSVTAK